MMANKSDPACLQPGRIKDQLHCGVCEHRCDTVLKFIQHKITHVDRGNDQGCEICKLAFSRQAALYEHYRRKHSIVFDTTEVSGVKVKSVKNGAVKTVKPRREKAKTNEIATELSVLDDVDHHKAESTSLPNGHIFKCDNSTNVKGTISQIYETSMLTEPPKLFTAQKLTSIEEVSHSSFSTDTALYSNSILPSSALLVSSSNVSGSLTGTPVLLIMQPQSGTCSSMNSAVTSLCSSTVSNNDLFSNISTSNATSELTDLYNQSHDNQDFEKHSEHSSVGEAESKYMYSDLDNSTQTTVVKSYHSHNRTEAYRQYVSGKTKKIKACENKASTNSENKLDLLKTNLSHSVQTDPSMVNSINDHTNIQERCPENDNVLNKEETNNVQVEDKGVESVHDEKTFSPSKSFVYCTRNFKKRGKLAPVAGKIPQELDMPDFCFIYFVTQGGKNEKSMHVGKDQFKCLFCTYVVRWRNSMCRHMREEHDNELLSGAALVTPLLSDTENGKVMKMTDYIEMEKAENPKKRIRGVETQDMLGEYICEQCGKVFNRLRYWRMHMQSHKKKKDVLCALCSKTFKTQQNLLQHLKTHEEKEPYKCPECDFVSSVNIAIHKHRQIHSGNSQICEICGQAYSDKSTLRKHKQVHDPARPFGCSIAGCTWRFRTKAMCDAHIQGHGSKRTFKCEVCGYAFRQKHHLQRHEKVVHNIVHEPKPSYSSYYSNKEAEFSGNQFEDISNDAQNEMEVPQGVNLIMNDGNISNVITPDHFDLESALQNGQLVIATDDGSINYEMSDIGSNVVYQTLLPEGETQQFETQTICIPQTDASSMVYEEVETIQSEVEIEQS